MTTTKESQSAPPVRIRMQIAGEWREAQETQDVRDPYRGEIVALAPVSSLQDAEDALESARKSKAAMAALPGHERARLLHRAADIVASRTQEIGRTMARETGKALRDALVETQRAAELMHLCAEEAVRIQGEHIPMDASTIGAGKIAMLMRYPVGVVTAITPFNGPISLTAHKLGPALAAGNSLVLKPSPKAPLCVHQFVEAVLEAGFPAGAINTLYGDAVGPKIIGDRRVDFVSFTGSIRVGKMIRDAVGMKRVALELGGVGPTFVHHDADIAAAAKACARNGVALAGQSCVSVQNVYVHKRVHDRFVDAVLQEVDAIRFGDPLDMATDVGTLIDEEAAIRVERMVEEAIEAGVPP
ncbi:MAG TPA: aldehyde dehydrogenase family protein, partial [Variovorax sp.]|nr:aldehyde dehydrogenase family protein [Variovorax sp.]